MDDVITPMKDHPLVTWLAYVALGLIFILAQLGCGDPNATKSSARVVWRASEENGCKPGVAYEIVAQAGQLSGTFFLIEPPLSGRMPKVISFPMTFTKAQGDDYVATMHFPNKDGADTRLRFRFEGKPDGETWQAHVQRLDGEYADQAHTFVRQR